MSLVKSFIEVGRPFQIYMAMKDIDQTMQYSVCMSIAK